MRIVASIDLDDLDEELAAELRQMIEEADFFNLPTEISSESTGADMFQYKLSAETDEQQHTVSIQNTEPPEALRTLIRRLTILARSQNQ